MKKAILAILHQGTGRDKVDYENRRIVYSNGVYLALPIVYIIFVVIDIKAYLVPFKQLAWDQFIFVVEIVICFAGLYLNKRGYSLAGRLLFILTWPFLLHIIPIIHQHTPSDYYFAYPVGIIFHSVLIQLMFSSKHETIIFVFLFALNAAMLVSSIDFLILNEDEHIAGVIAMVDDKYYRLVGILYWLLFSLVIYFLVSTFDNLYQDVLVSKSIIENQKEELTTINDELSLKNTELSQLNEQISVWNQDLETLVNVRTELIKAQNDKLRSYAFYNAHKLRGPFCRIQGLQNLLAVVAETEKPQIKRLLERSIIELEEVINEIQTIVTQEGADLNS